MEQGPDINKQILRAVISYIRPCKPCACQGLTVLWLYTGQRIDQYKFLGKILLPLAFPNVCYYQHLT